MNPSARRKPASVRSMAFCSCLISSVILDHPDLVHERSQSLIIMEWITDLAFLDETHVARLHDNLGPEMLVWFARQTDRA